MRAYKVKSGDTLWDIWKKDYSKSMSWDEFKDKVKALNKGIDLNTIYAGQILNLPDIPGFLRIALEHPTMYAISTFALGALFMVGVLYITKKLKL